MATPRHNPNLPPDSDVKNPGNVIPSAGQATIDAPEIMDDGQLDLEGLSVKTAVHAYEICTAAEQANKMRSMRTADIQSLYDGAAPGSTSDAQSKGMAWQANASTKFLAGLVDPAVMRAIQSVNGQVYITKSALPHSAIDWKEKSGKFQSTTTRVIRAWNGFNDFISKLANENFLHGYAYACWMDSQTWKPTFYKQENFYVPEESDQHAEDLQFCVAKHDYPLHDFIELFTDESSAESAGYDIENCVYAANHANIKNPREDAQVTQFRKFAEMISEGSLGLTYTKVGQRIVKVWMLWNKEYDGQVSFWLIDRDSGKLLRYVNKCYKSMTDVLNVFTLEPGNGHIHSSKGIGRKLAGLVVMTEKMRNRCFDGALMGGMLMMRADAKDRAKLQNTVMGPFMVFDKNIDLEQNRMGISGDTFVAMDHVLSAWAQQSSGSYVSAMIGQDGQRKTATEASIDSTREQEQGDAVRSRWIDQFAQMVNQMQRRLYSDESIAEAKREFEASTKPDYKKPDDGELEPQIVALIELFAFGLTEDEIKYLRNAPSSGLATIEDAMLGAGIGRVAAAYTGNPMIDQVELLKRSVEALAGPEAVRALVIPEISPTIESEQARLQLMEVTSMATLGLPVPISARDNHLVHAKTLQQLITATFPTLSKNPTGDQKLMKALELASNHMAEHLEALSKVGTVDPELTRFHKQFVEDYKRVVQVHAGVAVTNQIVAGTAAAVAEAKAAQGQGQTQGQTSPDGQPQEQPAAQAPAPTPLSPEERRQILANVARNDADDKTKLSAVTLDAKLDAGIPLEQAPAVPTQVI